MNDKSGLELFLVLSFMPFVENWLVDSWFATGASRLDGVAQKVTAI